MTLRILHRILSAFAVMLLPIAAPAQGPAGRLSDAGVYRAAALVDSVFADLVPLMAEVGSMYPALTKSGRDLLVAIPDDGEIQLLAGAVRVAISGPLGSGPAGTR